MKGSSHALAGIVTGIAISATISSNPFITIGLTTFGSLAPDIDEESSMINKILFPVSKNRRGIAKILVGAALLISNKPILKYIGLVLVLSMISARIRYKFSLWNGFQEFKYHRTFFHDPMIGVILLTVPLIGFQLPHEYITPYIIGLASHYFLDMFTAYGLPIYILGNKRVKIPFINYHSGNDFMEYALLTIYILTIVLITNTAMTQEMISIVSYFIKL